MAYIHTPPLIVPRGAARSFGDDTTAAPASSSTALAPSSGFSISDALQSDNVKLASGALMAYHGYRRSNGSLFWAALWALAGRWSPEYVVPLALAQGFGRRKVWSTVEGPR